jgi:YVTN family beta-propeller protein
MNARTWTTAIAAAVLLTAGAGAQSGGTQASGKGVLLVLSKGDTTLSLVDPESRQVIGRVPSGPDPHEVTVSADRRTAYVSNYGGGAYNTLTVIDLEKRAILQTVDLGALRGPHGVEEAGGKIWFTAEAAKVVARYDPASRQVDLVQGTGQERTHMVEVTRDLSRMLTTNISSATVSIFDARPGGRGGTGWTHTVVPVGRGAEGFDLSPDEREAWVANAQDGTISVLDLASKRVAATIDANVRGANRLKFTPDGRRVLVTSLSGSSVAVFDAASRAETQRIEVGTGAAGLLVEPDGTRAYAACTPDGYVAVIDLQSMQVIGRIEAGRSPDGLAWVPAR